MIEKSKVKSQKSKLNGGFTLVELLASIIVLVAVGSIIAGIISSSLRGANKTNTIENIRQNGNYALAQMSKDIEYAQTFEGLSTNGVDYVTSCPFSTPTPPATPEPVPTDYAYIKIIPLNGNQTIYNCAGSTLAVTTLSGTTPTPTPSSLVNMDSVSLKECKITCIQTRATDIPVIKIRFKLGPTGSNNLVEKTTPPILFETSVTIRNYKK
ncbi:MAG: hypothetical protein US48_C0012G0008 [Candidatus Levybacteria bacterium GW2011_GWA2_37_36]|nr:MAG: hypothetical protein US43_C0019G0016 [Candidatus Levybacteria bacterium GW2011_GWA1_37_16]KKQ33731.1 MAG: hypothetical protein US48_C0012G0008 [Candidatus Levybacteria bacterium GW2011_GWA2_37_36]KKQ37202.1 MAG: hypothetical protein US55_C0038G0002 [Candidatus Levybacteria bacterium GW2011_GWC2_37_7]KKQ41783.1 MAG: hypothetical protein US59_C0022G0009 [Candidatus Levybacteria bacterium GW2011_GWB1_37_8]OGH49861.1 MAG: hypothetical protein A3H17_01475 [Candidatus Levybacteria bacterium R